MRIMRYNSFSFYWQWLANYALKKNHQKLTKHGDKETLVKRPFHAVRVGLHISRTFWKEKG